mmetsp:Transcript_4081/g.8253  ORF Transcript_4081/g.8253 Transcript_4081/m.8253 type:complete len:472 (-) Transcript_4081:204-1619(-)
MRAWKKKHIIIAALLLVANTRLSVTGLCTRKIALLKTLHYHDPFNNDHSAQEQQQHAALAKFYRHNGSRLPRMKPGEVQYTLWQPVQRRHTKDNHPHDDDNNNHKSAATIIPIASLRMCLRYDEGDATIKINTTDTTTAPTWIFLRALCVATDFRRQGWALELLQRAISKADSIYHYQKVPVYLFADPSLSLLYQKTGFVALTLDSNQQDQIHHDSTKDTTTARSENDLTVRIPNAPNSLRQRYDSINRRLKSRGVCVHCFGYFYKQHCDDDPVASQPPNRGIHVLFLQHHKEVWRKTGTAALVQQAIVEKKSNMASYLEVSNFTWTGRADNESLEQLLGIWQRTGRQVVLLWKGGTQNVTEFLPSVDTGVDPPTFVLIDGTWQEAHTMFRKIPSLTRLPRLELQARNLSDFRLRGNFGWKERFGNKNADSLLCTVEVVAELLDQAGRVDEGNELRQRLKDFTLQFDRPKQ